MKAGIATRHIDAPGFSLIEMIVVLVVLGLVLGLVVTRGPAHSRRLDLDASARQLASALRVARSRAIADERIVQVSIGPSTYRVDLDAPIALSRDVLWAGNRAIAFTPDGGSTGGSIILRTGTRQVTIGVDWLTGRVVLSESG